MAAGGLVLYMDGLYDDTGKRCIGVDSGLIHAIRIIAPCLMTGQAAGTAAALCVSAGTLPRNMDVRMLRKQRKRAVNSTCCRLAG